MNIQRIADAITAIYINTIKERDRIVFSVVIESYFIMPISSTSISIYRSRRVCIIHNDLITKICRRILLRRIGIGGSGFYIMIPAIHFAI